MQKNIERKKVEGMLWGQNRKTMKARNQIYERTDRWNQIRREGKEEKNADETKEEIK